MIRRYEFGKPYDTDAVVCRLPRETGPLPWFEVRTEKQEDGSSDRVILSMTLDPRDLVFGLGESMHGINKRGYRYESWNIDEPRHTEDRKNLYASHNLLVFFGPEKCFGIYLDDPGRVFWDLGFTRMDRVEIVSENGDLNLYLLEEPTLKDLARAFRKLTGASYLPPRWAFGYIQSRWGYASEQDVRTVAEEHRKRGIPLDALCMDIDYMDRFRNFTWNREAFPDLAGFSAELKRNHLRLVPIMDTGIRKEEGYEPYDSGKELDAFCRKADGTEFVAAVWPGFCCFPDYLRPDVREWFGDLYRPMLEAGIEGFWNDMNEPALFYSEESLAEAYARADKLRGGTSDYEAMWGIKGSFFGMENNPEDFRRFYHQLDGRTVRHDKVHNLYGAHMSRATADGFRRYEPEVRRLLFSRSSFIGAHRNGGIWMGDNASWWTHLKLALQMLPNLNLCGFLYCGCDLGGFGDDATEDLLARFLQLGVFMPLMRNHSALHTREQEIYRFASWEAMRDTVTVRYALLPWLYSEFMKTALTDGMLFRPLAFDYPEDQRAIRVEDQLMLGEGAMIAPVYEANAMGRYVYLPERMLLIRFRSASDYDLEVLEAGDHYVPFGLHEFPLFLRENHLVPLCAGGQSSEELDDSRLTLLGFGKGPMVYDYYRDDGKTAHPGLEAGLTRITVEDGRISGPGLRLQGKLL